jgi:hypothetical protein
VPTGKGHDFLSICPNQKPTFVEVKQGCGPRAGVFNQIEGKNGGWGDITICRGHNEAGDADCTVDETFSSRAWRTILVQPVPSPYDVVSRELPMPEKPKDVFNSEVVCNEKR